LADYKGDIIWSGRCAGGESSTGIGGVVGVWRWGWAEIFGVQDYGNVALGVLEGGLGRVKRGKGRT